MDWLANLSPLRWYQDISKISEQFRKGHRKVLVVMPTGAGKTLTSFHMIARALGKGRNCLFLTDRRGLARQIHRNATDSGFDVGMLLAGIRAGDAMYPFQVAGKDTLLARAVRTRRMELPPADFVIVDEAHRAGAREWRKLLDQYPNAWFLGLTATPIYPNGSGMGGHWDAMVELVKPSQLLEEGFLVPSVCFAPDLPDLKGLKPGANGEWKDKDLSNIMSRKNMVGNAVGWWRKMLSGRRTLGFACDRDHAKHLQNLYLHNGIRAGYLDQNSTDEEFDTELQKLADHELDIIWNVGKCIEGIDVPAIDAIQLMRPFRKIVSPLQIFGRAMRPCKATGKTDMVVVDHSGTVLLHGVPGTDIDWPFSPEEGSVESIREKQQKERPQPKEVRCRKCGFIFKGLPACPNCGTPLAGKAKDRAMGTVSGQLVRVTDRDLNDKDRQVKVASDEWMRALAIAANKGYTFSTAQKIFHDRMGYYPRELNLTPRILPENIHRKVAEIYPKFVRGKRNA